MLRIKIKSLATSFDINKINMISNLNSKFASVNKVEASQTSTLSLLVLTKRKLHKAAAFDKSSKTDWVQRYWNREDKRVTVRQLVIIPYMVVDRRFITLYGNTNYSSHTNKWRTVNLWLYHWYYHKVTVRQLFVCEL